MSYEIALFLDDDQGVCISCQFPPVRLSLIFHELKWPIVLSNITFIIVLMTDIGRL